MATLTDTVNLAFHHAGLALDADIKLGNPLVDLGDDRNALVRQASDHYTLAVEMLLTQVMPHYEAVKDDAAKTVLADGISFLMNRLAAIEPAPTNVLRRKSSSASSSAPGDDDHAAATQRFNVVREIVDTEKRYVKSLEDLIAYYMTPLKDQLLDDEFTLAFAALPAILNLGKQMIAMLEAEVGQWDPARTCIGGVFVRLAPFLKMYAPYTSSFKAAQEMLATHNVEALEQAAVARGVPVIGSLLIMPVQRIPRYVLLLTDLKKKTPAAHPDYKLIKDALDKVSRVATAVNEQMRASEMDAKVLAIQNSLWSASGSVPELVAPQRKFVREGPVAKVRQNGTLKRNFVRHRRRRVDKATDAMQYLFCFNDIVVYTTKSPLVRNRFHFHKTLEFFGAFAADDEARALGTDLKYGEAAFKITGSNGCIWNLRCLAALWGANARTRALCGEQATAFLSSTVTPNAESGWLRSRAKWMKRNPSANRGVAFKARFPRRQTVSNAILCRSFYTLVYCC